MPALPVWVRWHLEVPMPYTLQYFPEQRLILIRVTGAVSLAENREIGLRISDTLEAVEPGVTSDLFFDLRTIGRFPTSISELRKTSAIIRSAKLGWIILLTGNNPLLKFVATVLIQLQTSSARMRVFDTLGDATNFLQATQPTSRDRIDWLDALRKSLESISV